MKLLIIDDSKFMRKTLETKLNFLGMKIYDAESGQQGLELAREVLPDLILLDVRMPGMDGVETCKKLREIESLKKVPIIMVTVESKEESFKKAIEAGAIDYVIKPINYDDLLRKIDKHLKLD
ncbi:MAG TPA: response regulator [archaeon]|nr:response regulator [archaeon]